MLRQTIHIVIFSVVFSQMTSSYAKDLGVVGATYGIAEKDALSEIEARAREVDWSKHINKAKAARSFKRYRPEGMAALPRARKDRSFIVDMTYTLPFDIFDGKGGILYPKGYTFNPLDYLGYRMTLVVIDGADKAQVEWFKRSPYFKEPTAKLLLSGGSHLTLSESLRRPVYYADLRIIERFRLAAVPSVISQKGRVMEVKEIDVSKPKGK